MLFWPIGHFRPHHLTFIKAGFPAFLDDLQVRRWYSATALWVTLDQDRAHPCKSRQTRRVMRELGLHWISLPKAASVTIRSKHSLAMCNS